MKDLAYNGSVMLPALGVKLHVKGDQTGNVCGGCRHLYTLFLARRHEQIVLAVRYVLKMVRSLKSVKQGTCALDKNSVIVSAHGTNAKILEQLQIGDRASVQQTLGDTVADKS